MSEQPVIPATEMKGAARCPRCGSRRTTTVEQPLTNFYARTLRVCGNCATAWEPFDPAELMDKSERLSCFLHPCDNCAFRKNSPERQDAEKWELLQQKIALWEGAFYCHKGVPIAPGTENGFDYPLGEKGRPTVRKLRLCRGYLNAWGKRHGKIAGEDGAT